MHLRLQRTTPWKNLVGAQSAGTVVSITATCRYDNRRVIAPLVVKFSIWRVLCNADNRLSWLTLQNLLGQTDEDFVLEEFEVFALWFHVYIRSYDGLKRPQVAPPQVCTRCTKIITRSMHLVLLSQMIGLFIFWKYQVYLVCEYFILSIIVISLYTRIRIHMHTYSNVYSKE